MPLARLERTRRAYVDGDFHREHRSGHLDGQTWIPEQIMGGVWICDGPAQAAREAGATFIRWNDRLWTLNPLDWA